MDHFSFGSASAAPPGRSGSGHLLAGGGIRAR